MQNLDIVSFIHILSMTSMGKKMWYSVKVSKALYSPTKSKFFLLQFFSPCIITFSILCTCLIISTVMGELHIVSRCIRALIQFSICLRKTLALLGKGSTASCNKSHALFKSKFASSSPSKKYTLYTETTWYSFANSSTYEFHIGCLI